MICAADAGSGSRSVDLEALRRKRAERPQPERTLAARTPSAPPRRKFRGPTATQAQLQLNKDIQACASADAVLDLVSSQWAILNEVNAATALTMIQRRAGKQSARLRSDARFAQLLSVAESLFERMGPQALSNMIYACGQLANTPPPDWLERFWHASAVKLDDFEPQGFSNTIYACGQLGITPPADWLERFWNVNAVKLGKFLPQNLSNKLYACGQLGITPPDDWLPRFWHASAAKLSEFDPQALSNTLYACGLLGLTPPADWLERFWLASATKLGDFKPQELSNTLYACGQLGMTPPADWMQRFWHACALKLGDFISQHFSNTLYACGQLGITPPADWLERYWHFSASKFGDFKPQALSNTLYACGQLGITPPAAWLVRFWPASASKLGEFEPQALSNTLYACGQLGLTPPPDYWLPRFWHASAVIFGDFTPQDFSNTVYACGQLAITPPADWLQLFSSSCEHALPDMNPQNLTNTAVALAMLQVWDLPLWHSLWERLCISLPRDVAGWSADDLLNARQIYQAYQAAAVKRPNLLPVLDPELLAAARKSWIDQVRDGGDYLQTGRFHDNVSACLMRMGVAHANERWCERAERSIDIAIEGMSMPVALEVDGPHHFLQDGRSDGSTLLRNRMLAAHGWRVVVVDYRMWRAQQTQEEQEHFLRRLLA